MNDRELYVENKLFSILKEDYSVYINNLKYINSYVRTWDMDQLMVHWKNFISHIDIGLEYCGYNEGCNEYWITDHIKFNYFKIKNGL